jgi:hypothetical protein
MGSKMDWSQWPYECPRGDMYDSCNQWRNKWRTRGAAQAQTSPGNHPTAFSNMDWSQWPYECPRGDMYDSCNQWRTWGAAQAQTSPGNHWNPLGQERREQQRRGEEQQRATASNSEQQRRQSYGLTQANTDCPWYTTVEEVYKQLAEKECIEPELWRSALVAVHPDKHINQPDALKHCSDALTLIQQNILRKKCTRQQQGVV